MRKHLRCGFLVLLTVATISVRPACAQSDAPIAPRRRSPPLRSGKRHSFVRARWSR